MESDDDYASLSPPVHHRSLKRLKKAIEPPDSSEKRPSSIEDLIPIPRVDFAELEALEASETPDLDEDSDHLLPFPRVDFAKLEALEALEASKILDSQNSSEPLPSKSVNDEADVDPGFSEEADGMNQDLGPFDEDNGVDLMKEKPKETKRALEFHDFNEVEENVEKSEKKRRSKGDDLDEEKGKRTEKKKKKKRSKSDEDGEIKAPTVNRRKEEMDRKAYLKQLHDESQRVLRETRDASFRPIPVVHKPISSLLEKIRQRKLQVSNYASEKTSALQEVIMDLDSDDVEIEEIEVQKSLKPVEDERVECDVDAERSKTATRMNDEKAFDEKPAPAFRAPVDDTQDLFGDSQERDSKDQGHQLDSPVEEAFAPSILAMKLKFDSAPPDDSSSEDEDDDKENMDPHLHRDRSECNSPKGDPVKAFVDEEAEEEADSDNDIGFLKEDGEDEDIDDSEELNDIIATEYEERPIDNEKRNELHQKWLEQQDAAGTDNLLQRFKHSSKYRETTLLDEDKSDNEDEEDFNDEVENEVPRNTARMTSKRAKQMIVQMFLDKDDGFLSDEDEETEKRLTKQRLLVRSEERVKLVSPAEDESSREVFGLIKKLNIAPDNKKKPKASSFFDTMVRGSTSISSKSSFLGRVSNHSFPSSHKQGASVVRSFVFGRDDSNSRSSISMSEDSSDTGSVDTRSSRSATAKFSCSQIGSGSQRSSPAGEMAAGSSLFEILKRSSAQASLCNQSNKIDLSQSVFNAFKIPKKSVKIEGRS